MKFGPESHWAHSVFLSIVNRRRWWGWCTFGRCVVTRRSWTLTQPGDSWTSQPPALSKCFKRRRRRREKRGQVNRDWEQVQNVQECGWNICTHWLTYIYFNIWGQKCCCVSPETVFAHSLLLSRGSMCRCIHLCTLRCKNIHDCDHKLLVWYKCVGNLHWLAQYLGLQVRYKYRTFTISLE